MFGWSAWDMKSGCSSCLPIKTVVWLLYVQYPNGNNISFVIQI